MSAANVSAALSANKASYDAILAANTVTIGSMTIKKMPETEGVSGIFAGINNAILDGAEAVSDAGKSLTTDVGTGTSGQKIGTATDVISRFKLTGTSTIGSVVSSFESGNIAAGVSSAMGALSSLGSSFGSGPNASNTTNGGTLNIGETLGFDQNNNSSTNLTLDLTGGDSSTTKTIKGYTAPIKETIETIQAIGKDFDKIIEESFLGQIFKIKGSEILCALFCIIISMLPCSVRQVLYDAVTSIKDGLAMANSTLNSINSMTKKPVEVPLFNEKTVADNVKSLFSDKLQGTALNNVLNTPIGTETRKPTSSIDIPQDVLTIINNVVLLVSILAKGQITIPVGFVKSTSTIWSFAQAVLSIVQAMLTQVVDEFLTKVVKQVEQDLKGMMPQMCVGNLASKFINKIMEAIKALKAYLLKLLKNLLGDSSGFGLKWKTFGWYFKELQDLLAMLKALQLILKKFPDLLLQCGLSPCNESDAKEYQDIKDAIQNGLYINETNAPAKISPTDMTPKGKTLDELAGTFQSMTGNPNAYVVQGDNGFFVVMPNFLAGAPPQIINLANSNEFLQTLGSAYTINPTDAGLSVTYTYELTQYA